jgi:hypothetical protein
MHVFLHASLDLSDFQDNEIKILEKENLRRCG